MTRAKGERFFFIMGLVLLGFVIAGFVPPALARPGGITTIPLLFHVHGGAFLAWFVLFCVQAWLVGAGNKQLHMRLGRVSLVLVMAMVVLGYLVTRATYANPDFSIAGLSAAASIMFPFTDIVNLLIVYSLALAHRRNSTVHKRFMLLAGMLMMDPAVARLVITLDWPVVTIFAIELGLLLALLVYDVLTRRRPSWASLTGVGLYVAALFAKFGISEHPAWAAFVEFAFG